MIIPVDLSSPLPLYRQIAAGVRRAVVLGELRPGDRLPPGRELAEALDVNLETVQRAYRELAADGLVVSRVGRGTRVVDSLDPTALALDEAIDGVVTASQELGLDIEQLIERIRRRAS